MCTYWFSSCCSHEQDDMLSVSWLLWFGESCRRRRLGNGGSYSGPLRRWRPCSWGASERHDSKLGRPRPLTPHLEQNPIVCATQFQAGNRSIREQADRLDPVPCTLTIYGSMSWELLSGKCCLMSSESRRLHLRHNCTTSGTPQQR